MILPEMLNAEFKGIIQILTAKTVSFSTFLVNVEKEN